MATFNCLLPGNIKFVAILDRKVKLYNRLTDIECSIGIF